MPGYYENISVDITGDDCIVLEYRSLSFNPNNATSKSVTAGYYSGGTLDSSAAYNAGKAAGVTTHTGTYTFAANSTGSTVDLGSTHTYRYINASNVYNTGRTQGQNDVKASPGTYGLESGGSYNNGYSKGVADTETRMPSISYVESASYSLTINNALQYKKIIVIGAEGAAWHEKTGGLSFSVTGGTVESVKPSDSPYNKEAISAIVTPTANTVTVYLSTYNPEEGLTYSFMMAYCIS